MLMSSLQFTIVDEYPRRKFDEPNVKEA